MVVGRRINSGAVSLCDAHPRVVLNFRTVFSEGRKKIKSSGMFLLVFELATSVRSNHLGHMYVSRRVFESLEVLFFL